MSPKWYPPTKIAAAAASIAVVGAFGVGAASLAQADMSFDPRAYVSAYGQGENEADKGYRANPTDTDAEANRHEDDADDQDKSADADRTSQDDAFSDVPFDGASGTTAVNVTGDGASGGAVAGGDGSGEGSEGIAGPVVPGEGNGGGASDNPDAPSNPDSGKDPVNPPKPGGNNDPTPPSPTPDPTPTPSPDPTPDEPSQPENPSEGGWDVLPEDPVQDKSDENSTWFEFETVTGNNTSLSGTDVKDVSVQIGKGLSTDSALYTGQKLDDWSVFCALSATFTYGSRNYQWYCKTKEDFASYDLFRIVSYPETVPEGAFDITVEYRIRTSDEWTRMTISYEPELSCVFIVSSEKDDAGNPIVLGQARGSSVNLLGYTEKLLRSIDGFTTDIWGSEILSKMVLGWTEGTSSVGPFYTPSAGRHVISPGQVVDVPAGYEMTCGIYWFDDDFKPSLYGSLCYLQTLSNVPDAESLYATDDAGRTTFEVAEGVQAIDLGYTSVFPDKLSIPASTLYVNTEGALWARQAYAISPDNPVYAATESGILTSKDGTEYLGIPTDFDALNVPATVTKVDLPQGLDSNIRSITLHAETGDALPDMSLSRLSDCNIVVEDSAFDAFVTGEFSSVSTTNNLTVSKASNSDAKYRCDNGLVYADGVLDHYADASSSIALVGGPYTIAEGCFGDAENVRDVVLTSDGAYTLEDGCFNEGITTIVCSTPEQKAYVEGRLPQLGASPLAQVILAETSTDGYRYYTASDIFTSASSTTVFEAPASVTVFDGTIQGADGTIAVNAIAPRTFANHTELTYVPLNESVESIGTKAFAGCSGIEGVFIGQTKSITIENGAFSNCGNIGFFVSRAATATLASDFSAPNYSCLMYAPTGSEGYLWASTYQNGFLSFTEASNVLDYTLIEQDGAYLVYGCYGNGTPWLALASSSNLHGTVTLPATTVEIFGNAFATAENEFFVNWNDLKSLQFIDSNAFCGSGVSGEVYLPGVSGGENIIAEDAFASCPNITSVACDAEVLRIDAAAFAGCENLTSVKLGMSSSSAASRVFAGAFNGCTKLETIQFTSSDPCFLGLYNAGVPFQFDSSTYWGDPAAEAEKIKVVVPEGAKESYLKKWIYPFAGATDYEEYRSTTVRSLRKSLGHEPSGAEVAKAMEESLLEAENRLRAMIGLDAVEHSSFLAVTEADDGFVFQEIAGTTTLLAAPEGATEIDFSKVIPDSTYSITIGSGALSNCSDLKRIVLSNKVTGISVNAFAGCDGVTVELPDTTWPISLVGWSSDAPFTFGANVKLVAPEGMTSTYIDNWVYNLVGATGYDSYYSATMEKLYGDWPPLDDSEVIKEMSANLLPAENTLRRMFGLDEVEASSYVSIADNDGYEFQTIQGTTTLVSVPSDATVVDLNEVIPDSMSGVVIGENAFLYCNYLERVVLSNKVSGIQSGAFNKMPDFGAFELSDEFEDVDATDTTSVVEVVLPSVKSGAKEATIELLGGDSSETFSFGNYDVKLSISEDSIDAYLTSWPRQCIGICSDDDLSSYVFSKLFGMPFEEEITATALNEAVNKPFIPLENYIRKLAGLDEVETIDGLTCFYDASYLLSDWNNPWADDSIADDDSDGSDSDDGNLDGDTDETVPPSDNEEEPEESPSQADSSTPDEDVA